MENIAETFRNLVRWVDARLPEDVRAAWGGNALTPYVADIREVASRLNARDVAGMYKYPCVILPRDFLEVIGTGGVALQSATVLVVAGSSNAYTSEEREAKVFVPVLYPIVSALLDAMRLHGVLGATEDVRKVDRQHLAAALNEAVIPTVKAGIFNDMLDGVELRGMDLYFDCDINKRLSNNQKLKL